MTLTGALEVVNLSDTGRRRPHNEDSSVSDASIGLMVVADGMGGYRSGEVASAIAVSSIVNRVRHGLAHLKSRRSDNTAGYSEQSLLVKEAIVAANRAIFQTAQQEEQCQGMGTTVISVLFYDDRFTVAHVGDSRLYRLRGDTFEQVTSDHSLVQELIDRGLFTPEEAAVNTPKNLVTRALGIDETVEVDIHEDTFKPGDIYLLCTDGLNDMVNDEEIHLTLSKYSANLVEAAQRLIAMANDSGGKDNISVILARPLGRLLGSAGWTSKLKKWFT